MWDKALVPRIPHGRIPISVYKQSARRFVHLVLDGFPSHRHLDDDVDIEGRLITDRYSINIHGILGLVGV